MSKKKIIIIIIIVLIAILGGISLIATNQKNNFGGKSGKSILNGYDSNYESEDIFKDGMPKVEIGFGYDGKKFTATMEDNETAVELVRNITSSGRNLPIYNFDNYDGYEYYQYYDIPSSYKISSNPVKITHEKAGEIYYAKPNRIMLFYKDAEIEGNFVLIGHIDNTKGLENAVEKNPQIENWGNKIITINYAK